MKNEEYFDLNLNFVIFLMANPLEFLILIMINDYALNDFQISNHQAIIFKSMNLTRARSLN